MTDEPLISQLPLCFTDVTVVDGTRARRRGTAELTTSGCQPYSSRESQMRHASLGTSFLPILLAFLSRPFSRHQAERILLQRFGVEKPTSWRGPRRAICEP